jgi:hypothetical protein
LPAILDFFRNFRAFFESPTPSSWGIFGKIEGIDALETRLLAGRVGQWPHLKGSKSHLNDDFFENDWYKWVRPDFEVKKCIVSIDPLLAEGLFKM